LIKEVHEDSRRRDARFAFRLIYQETLRGRFLVRDLGMVYNGRVTVDDEKTLDDARFIPGDFIDVAIYFGRPTIAPTERESGPAMYERGRRPHPRFNEGFGGRYHNNDRPYRRS